MAIYAISDLHLSFGCDKPMDIFGGSWENHTERLKSGWCDTVGDEDLVLIPGDISWAMGLETAKPDFSFIEALPGRKLIGKGNHDYWWSTKNKFDAFLRNNGMSTISMLHNNAYPFGNFVICGSRGWLSPDDPDFTGEDQKVFTREIERLKMSLNEGVRLGGEIIAMLHYPPFDQRHNPNAFAEMLQDYGVKTCVYGHIHGKANPQYRLEWISGIRYQLISADFLEFRPVRLE